MFNGLWRDEGGGAVRGREVGTPCQQSGQGWRSGGKVSVQGFLASWV